MAPCFGTIARIARSNGYTKVLCQVDNVEPHEPHIIDRPCNRYFLGAVSGFVYMSERVHTELRGYTSAPALYSPHPMFEEFGGRVSREEACARLGLDGECRYALFFGLIRDYKGLDMLLEAWGKLKREGLSEGRKLLIAGEFYTSQEPYLKLIEEQGIADSVVLHAHFIADDNIKYYFSAADFLVLPYRTATQSGVTQIAYNFSLPMLVTRVGGLPEIVVHERVGRVSEPTCRGIAEGLAAMWSGENLARYVENMVSERERFSWGEMCRRIIELYEGL